MTLEDRGAGNLDEAGSSPEFFDRAGAAVTHACAEAADELEDEVGQGPLVGDATFHSLGDELLGSGAFTVAGGPACLLAVSFVRALGHGAERAHAAVGLEAPAAVDDRLAGALGQSGEEAADH